jgi:L-alanine-DL-glutamate epimerase-like enolase superfamily enzyme
MSAPNRIAAVETLIVSLPLERPVVTPIHNISAVDNVLVTVRTDTGLSGISYLWTFGVERARILAAMVEDLGRSIVGLDALERSAIWTQLAGSINFLGRAGIAMFGLSALDIALWDIGGKAIGLPLWRLLGGTARPVPCYAGGLFLSDGIDAIVTEARGYLARGFSAMKMRAGAKDWRDDVARVEAVRDAIGPATLLMVDVVQGWTPEQAIRMGRELARFDLHWIEDPVLYDDVEGLARVAAALDVPIVAGENDYGKLAFRRLIEGRAVDIAMADLQRVGGITEWMKVASLAEAWSTPIVPHVFHEISAHLMAATPNCLHAEYVPWWDLLFEERVPVVNGTITPPSGPGLGLAFNETTIDKHRVA